MGGLFEEVGVDIAETCAAGTDFFLHPHQMAEKQFLVFFIVFFGQLFNVFGNGAYAFYADKKHGREHLAGVFANRAADNVGQGGGGVFRRPFVSVCRSVCLNEADCTIAASRKLRGNHAGGFFVNAMGDVAEFYSICEGLKEISSVLLRYGF